MSVIRIRGLFVVTQIAAVNLVTGKMTFAEVWVTCSARKEPLLPTGACDTSAPLWIRKLCRCSLTGSGARFHTKGSRLVIMMSRYQLFTVACADKFHCVQTNPANDCIHNYKSVLRLHLPSLYFGKNDCFKSPPGTPLKLKKPFWC